jgi:hypothetical protein
MPLQYIFWGIYILYALFGFWVAYEPAQPRWTRWAGAHLVIMVLIGILGYHVFGSAVKG